MEAIREYIEVARLMSVMTLPEKFINRKLEIIVIPVLGQEYPAALVKPEFFMLNDSHIEYVIGSMGKNTTKQK